MSKIANKVTLEAVLKLDDRLTSTLKNIISKTDKAKKKIELVIKVDGVDEKEDKTEKIKEKLKKLNESLLETVDLTDLAKKGFDLIASGIQTSADLMAQENLLKAAVGSKAGSALFDYNKAYARESMFDVSQVNDGAMGFLNYTRDINQLDRMQQMAERLYAKDPGQGAESAIGAMKNLLSGDASAVQQDYGILGVSGEQIRSMMGSGNVEGALDYIDASLNEFGATAELLEASRSSLMNTWEMFTTNLATDWGEALTNAAGNANVFVQTLYNLQQAGNLQPLLDAAASAANALAIGLAWVGENLNWILPIAGGAAIGILVFTAVTKGMEIAAGVTKFALALLNGEIALTTIVTGPMIFAIIAGVAALLLLTGAFGKASDAMGDFIGNKMESLRELAGAELGNTELPVSIANTEPISVRGEVQIEDQSIKYIYDLAEARRMQEYSGVTVNVNSSFGDIHRDADADYILDELIYRAQTELAGAPLGVAY